MYVIVRYVRIQAFGEASEFMRNESCSQKSTCHLDEVLHEGRLGRWYLLQSARGASWQRVIAVVFPSNFGNREKPRLSMKSMMKKVAFHDFQKSVGKNPLQPRPPIYFLWKLSLLSKHAPKLFAAVRQRRFMAERECSGYEGLHWKSCEALLLTRHA